MAIIVRDGKGRGYSMGVNSDRRAEVSSVEESLYAYINRSKEYAFMYYSDVTPQQASSVFCYMANTSIMNLILVEMRCWTGGTAEAFDIYFNPVGTPSGGTTVTPVNTNLGSGKTATSTFLEGAHITGLSGGVLFDRLRFPGDSADWKAFWPGQIVVPPGAKMSIQALVGAIPIEISMSFFYQEMED